MFTGPLTPSQQQLYDNHIAYLQQALAEKALESDDLSALDAELARENNKVLAYLLATGLDGNYKYMREHLARQMVPTTSTGWWFEEWINLKIGGRKQANPANGNVIMTGTPATMIPVDTELQNSDGLIYAVDTDTVIDGTGQAVVPITATIGGSGTNLSAGAELTLVASLPGIDATATVDVDGLERGTDTETDAEALYRLRQREENPPSSGAPGDYERWALMVPGITRAWGLRTPAGPCTAGVIIMADDNGNNGIPTAADQQAVYDYITDHDRGAPDELFVIIPTPLMVDVDLSLTPDTQAGREAVELELLDLFYREAEPGVEIPHTHLVEAVSIATGEHTHVFNTPAIVSGGAIEPGEYEIPVLGEVTFS